MGFPMQLDCGRYRLRFTGRNVLPRERDSGSRSVLDERMWCRLTVDLYRVSPSIPTQMRRITPTLTSAVGPIVKRCYVADPSELGLSKQSVDACEGGPRPMAGLFCANPRLDIDNNLTEERDCRKTSTSITRVMAKAFASWCKTSLVESLGL